MQVSWVPVHAEGDSEDARGNDWADTLAKWGAAIHRIEDAVISEAKRTRKRYMPMVQWLGKSAAACGRQVVMPNRQPKED